MKRLYYLTKEIESVEAISQDLHDAGITDWNFHVLSKQEEGLYKHHIHSANILQKTDLLHSIERSLLIGLTIGLVAALALSQIPIHGSVPSFATLVGIFFAGILLGGWHGSLFGYQNESYKLKPFHDKIEQGYFLIMVDVKKKQIHSVRKLMQKKHPESRYCEQDTILAWPFGKAREIRF